MTAVEKVGVVLQLVHAVADLRERGYNAEAAEFDALYLVQAHRLEIEVAAALVEKWMTFE